MTRYCATCRQQRPLREFDLGGGQLSTTCLGCAHERLRTEDHLSRSQRNAQIETLEKRRRELIAALVKIDAEIADLRAQPSQTRTLELAASEKRRRELIAALVKIDAEIADLHARPTQPRIVLVDDASDADGSTFDEDVFGADPGDLREEMS